MSTISYKIYVLLVSNLSCDWDQEFLGSNPALNYLELLSRFGGAQKSTAYLCQQLEDE